MSCLALKIIGCLIIVSVSTFAGFIKSYSLYRRRDLLKSFSVFINSLATHIRYDSSDIFTLVRASAEGEIADLINNSLKETNEPFSLCWQNFINSIPKSYSLTDGDRQTLSAFGEKLGVTDVEGQLSHLELYAKLVSKQLNEAEEDITNKSKLYKTIGFFIGTSAALMLI